MNPVSGGRRTVRLPLCAGLLAGLALGQMPLSLPAIEVQNCGDGGPGSGSLRDVIATAGPGETIDLSQLPTKCGMLDSVISLSNGEIAIPQDGLTLQGPASGSVTIKPADGKKNRIFNHTGVGVLVLNHLIVSNGWLDADSNNAYGGCVNSKGTIFLANTTIMSCKATGTHAYGGGVYASDSAVLLESTVSGNWAIAAASVGHGGGIAVGNSLSILYSTLAGNEALEGGAAFSKASTPGTSIAIYNSTIENNFGACAAAKFYGATTTISNSTISSNQGVHSGGLCLSGNATIANSTIAFNDGLYDSGGLNIATGSLEIESSIVALNVVGQGVPELYVASNVTVTGADNLIVGASSNVPPSVIKLSSNPKLDSQLRFNGGRTRTHALLRGSPAVGAGNNAMFSFWDQRGHGYPRTTGVSYLTDIGAFQFDSIFYDGLEP